MKQLLGKEVKRVECDCSYPILHAVCEQFNGTTLDLYLKLCYMILHSNGKSLRLICVPILLSNKLYFSEKQLMFDSYMKCAVHVCGAHNMNSMKRFFTRHEVKDSEVKTLLMTIFCRILTCKEYDTIKYIFEKVCILTTSGSEFFLQIIFDKETFTNSF